MPSLKDSTAGDLQPPMEPEKHPLQQDSVSDPAKEESQIWHNAIQKYYDELKKGGIKGPAIDKDLWNIKSPVDLLEEIRAHESLGSSTPRTWMGSLHRLESILLGLNDFAAVTAWAMGMNGKVAAVVWGSIRLILNLAQPVLPEILNMLEELRRTLPRYKRYEQELPVTKALEEALSDMYTEIIIFCARTITFFRNNPNIGRSRNAWSDFNNEFLRTVENLRNYSRRVDEEADIIRMTREARSAETIDVVKNLKAMNIDNSVRLPCQMIPYGLNPRFLGRSEEVAKVEETLDPPNGGAELRVMAIHGLGGVGKTQLALHYAQTSIKLYNVIAWIPSETQIKMTQALSALARKLGLPKTGEDEDDYQASLKVRDWLNTSGQRFLLIFDNVEKIDILLQVWPASNNGSILITTRSPSVASKRATNIMHLQSFTPVVGPGVLYSLTGIKPVNDHDAKAAEELCHLLGGLPLAIAQLSDFIRDRGYSFEEFLPLYQRSSAKIHARAEAQVEYNYTLTTVWEFSMQKLTQDATVLLNLIVFFDPDKIEEELLTNPRADLDFKPLEFIADEFEFGEAVSDLVRSSLINRLSAHKALSVHRLVQAAVFDRLSKVEGISYLDSTVKLLSNGFPNTWTKSGAQQGHGWASWETTNKVLPHIQWVMELVKKHKLRPSNPELFAELIFRSGAYLWEREQPTTARSFLTYGLSLDVDRGGSLCNPAVRLLGHASLDMAQPQAALQAYTETLASRLKLVGPDDPAIADVCDSIACTYTELGEVTKAFGFLDRATKIHEANDPDRMARTVFCLAMNHLRNQDPDRALTALKHCWKLQGLTEEQVAVSRYPKHSGDIVLLARIELAKGNKDSALQLASKTVSIRKGILGNKGPRVADSMFLVARMLRDDGKDALTAKLLREIVDMSVGMVEMQGQLARALWTLHTVEEGFGNRPEAEELVARARHVRAGIEGREGADEDSDEGFARLVPWLLP